MTILGMTVFEFLTTIAAFAALGLSLWNFNKERQDKKPNLEISTRIETITIVESPKVGTHKTVANYLHIHISNEREKPVAISKVIIQLNSFIEFEVTIYDYAGDEHRISYSGQELPFVAEPQRGYVMTIDGDDFHNRLTKRGVSGLVTGRVLVIDEIKRIYKSNTFEFSVKDLETVTKNYSQL